MFGGTVKRGGGGKRNIHVPPTNRNSGGTSGSRLSSGGGHAAVLRGRDGEVEAASGPSTSSIHADETFSLVTRNPLNFAMALRLVPDLVEEINRVEAMGGTARIKFGINANNSTGNVINVGGKDFNFTWSREMGELCDIYEECKSGEDGSSLLIESGGAWRKLNVQRVLDESTKKHVKMRSEEAERKNKSRKSIVLDHQNSSVKSQMKALAAAESNSWRMSFKRKEIPLKKSKPDPFTVGPSKSVYKSGLSATNPSKVRPSPGSPLSSQSKHYGATAYPIGSSKGHNIFPDATSENKNAILDTEIPSRLANNTVRDRPRHTSVQQSLTPDKFDQLPEQDSFPLRTRGSELEERTKMNSVSEHTLEMKEKIDVLQGSPDHSYGKNVSDNSEGPGGSSSDGGSESDSESNSSASGSDSESHSRGKSRSPAGSRSRSSSDSESGNSVSSKQAPDEDVDIMTSDDDKEPKSEPDSSKSHAQLRPQYGEPFDLINHEKQDDWVSDVVEVENDNVGDDHDSEGAAANYLFCSVEKEEHVEEIKPSSAYHFEYHQTQDDESVVKDTFSRIHSDGYTKLSKGKFKRFSHQSSGDMPYNNKRLKGKHLSQPLSGAMSSLFGESPQSSSPDEPPESPSRQPIDQMANRDANDGNYDLDFQMDLNQGNQTKPISESQLASQRLSDASVKVNAPFGEKRSSKYGSLGYGVEESERGKKTRQSYRMQTENMEKIHGDGLVSERVSVKSTAGNVRDKHLTITESSSREPKVVGKVKDSRRHYKAPSLCSPENNNSNINRSPVMNCQGRVLQRELSELELGEFREPLPDEFPGPKKQIDRKGSYSQLQNKPTDSESWNSDSNRGKSSKKFIAESRKLSPYTSDAVVSGLPDGSLKQKSLENYALDSSRTHLRETQPMSQQQQSSALHAEFVSHRYQNTELSNGSRCMEAEKGQMTNLEANAYKKIPVKATEQKQGSKQTVVSQPMRDLKRQEPDVRSSLKDGQNGVSFIENYNDAQRRTQSFSDEINSSYMKYEKEEPELKFPIKNLPQYKEYVKEYQEKYERYSSLSKILESYRDEFNKLGNDLETYRGRDARRYQEILGQIKSSFRQCGEKHKRLKKIFNVLHEELQHLKQMIKDYAASNTKD